MCTSYKLPQACICCCVSIYVVHVAVTPQLLVTEDRLALQILVS